MHARTRHTRQSYQFRPRPTFANYSSNFLTKLVKFARHVTIIIIIVINTAGERFGRDHNYRTLLLWIPTARGSPTFFRRRPRREHRTPNVVFPTYLCVYTYTYVCSGVFIGEGFSLPRRIFLTLQITSVIYSTRAVPWTRYENVLNDKQWIYCLTIWTRQVRQIFLCFHIVTIPE